MAVEAFMHCRTCVAPKRHPGCHDTCQDYILDKKKWDELKGKTHKEKEKDKLIGDYKLNAVRKMHKKIRQSKNNK